MCRAHEKLFSKSDRVSRQAAGQANEARGDVRDAMQALAAAVSITAAQDVSDFPPLLPLRCVVFLHFFQIRNITMA